VSCTLSHRHVKMLIDLVIVQREANKDRAVLFTGLNKNMRAEEHMYSATDVADLEDDTDDDLPLIELARRALGQARSNDPWRAIKSAAKLAEEAQDDERELSSLDQEGVLEVSPMFAMHCSSQFFKR